MKLISPNFFACTVIILLLPSICFGQVSGIVLDQQNNRTIEGASVLFVEENRGAVTDENGFFHIKINTFPATLRISFIGFQPVEIVLHNDVQNLNVRLSPEVIEGERVTVSAERIVLSEQESRPIPVVRINTEDMLFTSRSDALEVLRAKPGIFVQQTSIGQGSVYVRGRAGRDVLYIFNNLRLNPGFVRAGQNQYFASIDPFSVAEITVYRGPVSVYYGSDALSGGVHVKPDIPAFSDSSETGGNFLAQANFFGTGERTLHGGITHQQDRFSFSLKGTRKELNFYNMPESSDDARWFPYNNTLNDADMSFRAVQGTGRYRFNSSLQLSWASYYSLIPDAPRFDRMILGYDTENNPVPSQPRNGYYSNTAPLVFSAHSATLHFSAGTSFFSNGKIQFGFHRIRDDRSEVNFEIPPRFSQNLAELNRDFTLSGQKLTDRNTSDQWLLSTDFNTSLSEQFSLNWGSDFIYEEITSRTKTNGIISSLPRYPSGSEVITGGIFLHGEYKVTPAFLLESGIRYSASHYKIPFEGIQTPRGFDPFSDTYSQFTGSVGLRYSLTPVLDFTSNISNGFRAPNVADLAELGIRRSDQYQTANTNLIPEKSFNADAGIQLHTDTFTLDTQIYWLHYFDKIERIFTGNIVSREGEVLRPGDTPQNSQEYLEIQSANLGNMNLYGFEFSGHVQIFEFLKAGSTFNYIWSEIENIEGKKEPVDRIPPANGLAYLAYKGIHNVTLRPQVRYNFSQRRISPLEIDDNRISRYGTDGFVNVQFAAVWETNEWIQIRMFADNLLNKSYREHASTLDGLQRNITLSFAYSF